MTQREQLLRELSQTEEERWASLTAGAGEDEGTEAPAERLHVAKEKAAAAKEKQKRAQQKQKPPTADSLSQPSQIAAPAAPTGPRQRTLFERSRTQGGAASQHMDVDALMKKFTQQEEEVESKIDISRFLKDDEDEGFGGAADDDPAFSAEGFLSALLSTGPAVTTAAATSDSGFDSAAATASGAAPHVRIETKGGLFREPHDDNDDDDARLVVPLSDDAAVAAGVVGEGIRKPTAGSKQLSAAQHRGVPIPGSVKTEGGTTKQNFVKKELAAAPQSIVATGTSTAPAASSEEQPIAAVKTEREDDSVQPPSDAAVYWLDAKEQDHTYAVDPGSLFLFGKCVLAAVPGGSSSSHDVGGTIQTESCCLRVRNVQRCVMILPKDGCEVDDAVKEVAQYCAKCGIRSFRLKVVSRHYAFEELNIPRAKRTWIKLKFPGSTPPLPPKSSWDTVEAVVGANRSLLELFLLKRRFRGPSYLKIAEWAPVPAEQRISFCKHEFLVLDPKHVTPLDGGVPPPLVVMSLNLHTQLDASNAHNEIHAVSMVVSRSISMEGSARSCTIASQVVGVRPFDAQTPLPVDLEKQCSNRGLRFVRRFANEQQLLQWTASTIREVDPDVLVGHNFHSFTLDVLLHRYQTLKVHAWSSLGKLDLRQMPKLQQGAGGTNESTFQEREVCTGRLVADTYLLAREYHRSSNYKLLVLAQQLGLSGIFGPVDDAQVDAVLPVLTRESMTSSAAVFDVLARCLNLCVLSLTLANQLDVIPLTKRLTALAGNLWSRTLFGSRAERIEYLLLHAFHELKFVTPDKKSYEAIQKMKRTHDDAEDDVGGGDDGGAVASSGRRGGNKAAKYKGGMVLEPKSGLYTDYVLLLDFNSLYPSLIQEFHICFTTVRRAGGGTVFEEGEDPNGPSEVPPPEALLCTECRAAGAPAPCAHKCILPKVIKGLVDSRREVRRLMKSERNPAVLSQLEIRQKALKLTANSMYGCLGFEFSRFYAQPLAELVTRQGRQALLRTVEMVPLVHPALRVLYGDTDSVMIQTGVKDDLRLVRDMANDIKAKVNKAYRCLEIDIDGIFRSILLHKKKKYAAVHVVDWAGEGKILKKEVKGLDMVRRDWCPLSHRCCDDILNRLLDVSSTAEGTDDLLEFLCQYMGRVADDVRAGNVYPLEDYVVSKSLTKEPETYKGTSFPHATVALRMRQRKEQVRVGDLIPYVVCVPQDSSAAGPNAPLSSKAFHPDEVRAQPGLALDVEWYLNTQLFPPVLRICEHIQGFSASQLGEAMHIHVVVDEGEGRGEGAGGNPVDAQRAQEALDFSSMFRSPVLEECFPTAVPLEVACVKCQIMTPIRPHDRVQSVVESWATQPQLADKPFPLYQCHACHHTLSPIYVSNCLYLAARRHIVSFYRSGGTPAALRLLRQQMTYYRAAFDVPHTPGYSRRLIGAHERLALRCVTTDPARATTLLTLESKRALERQEEEREKNKVEARRPSSAAAKAADGATADATEPEPWEIFDPAQDMLRALYDRMEHMFFHDIRDLLGALPAKRIKVEL